MKIKRYKGSIYVRGGTIWVARSQDGKRTYTSTGLPDTPVNHKRVRAMLEQNQFNAVITNAITVHALIEEYLKWREKELHPRTLKTYRFQLHRIFQKDCPTDKSSVVRVLKEFSVCDVSARLVHNSLTAFYTFWDYMKNVHPLPDLPAKKHINTRKPEQKEPDPYTEDEFLTLHKYLSEHDKTLADAIFIMYRTGARWGDLATLEWKDVLDSGIVWKNKITKKEEFVPCAHDVSVLLQHRITSAKGKYVFPWRNGHSRKLKALKDACEKCGVTAKGFHGFRKSFATRVFERTDIPIKDALALVRHKTIDVSLRHYVRKDDERLKSIADSL